jgi:hypothetical protein
MTTLPSLYDAKVKHTIMCFDVALRHIHKYVGKGYQNSVYCTVSFNYSSHGCYLILQLYRLFAGDESDSDGYYCPVDLCIRTRRGFHHIRRFFADWRQVSRNIHHEWFNSTHVHKTHPHTVLFPAILSSRNSVVVSMLLSRLSRYLLCRYLYTPEYVYQETSSHLLQITAYCYSWLKIALPLASYACEFILHGTVESIVDFYIRLLALLSIQLHCSPFIS